ncbi:MAG TPA: hypothetical protein VM869_09875 [Enhygromyxa sp.]|nr:hypothetical protein [Enhygromyxa sp.]
MDKRYSNLMFLLGVAPLAIGCETKQPNAEAGDETEGGDGSSESDESGMSPETSDSTDEGSEDEICGPYAEFYGGCDSPDEEQYVFEFCQYVHAHFQTYASDACLAAWEATRICFAGLECGDNPHLECADAVENEIQECYYNDGLYRGCDLYGMLVAECVSADAGATAEATCDQTYEELYSTYYSNCGEAFHELYICISKLDCAALEDPALIEAGCGPELAAKEQECSP